MAEMDCRRHGLQMTGFAEPVLEVGRRTLAMICLYSFSRLLFWNWLAVALLTVMLVVTPVVGTEGGGGESWPGLKDTVTLLGEGGDTVPSVDTGTSALAPAQQPQERVSRGHFPEHSPDSDEPWPTQLQERVSRGHCPKHSLSDSDEPWPTQLQESVRRGYCSEHNRRFR